MKIELHMHTSEVSSCGKVPAAEMVRLYKEMGYDAITVTDHLIAGKNSEMPMEERVAWYLSGYRIAKEEGKQLELSVLQGAEVRFSSGHEDLLLFGIREDDIRPLMQVLDNGIELPEFYHKILETGRMVLLQAHPFRNGLKQAPLDQLDGIEVYNGHPGHESHNDLAMARAKLGRPGFIMTSGSDAHQITHVGRSGIIADEMPLDSIVLAAWLRQNPTSIRIEN